MTTTVNGIYEHGKRLLPQPLSLPENAPVRVPIGSIGEEPGTGWNCSAAPLLKTRGKQPDDTINELLKRLSTRLN